MKLSDDLYGKDSRETKVLTWDEVPLIPTLIQSIYKDVTILFGKKESKKFENLCLAEQWAKENNIKIKIRHEAASKCFVGGEAIRSIDTK